MAVGVKGAFLVALTLTTGPPTEPIAIDGIGLRDVGAAVVFDVVEESAEFLLPVVGGEIPCPAGQFVKPVLTVGVKGAFMPLDALLPDPRTKPIAVDYVAGRDAGVAVAFDVAQELAGDDIVPNPSRTQNRVQQDQGWFVRSHELV